MTSRSRAHSGLDFIAVGAITRIALPNGNAQPLRLARNALCKIGDAPKIPHLDQVLPDCRARKADIHESRGDLTNRAARAAAAQDEVEVAPFSPITPGS